MQKLLSISTAARPSGSPPQQRLLKVPSGTYRGRIAALYADSASNISLKVADYPYLSWSAAQVIAGDAHDSPFSACIDSAGNIYLTYADTSQYLKVIKLTFSAGIWTAGSPLTVINVDSSSRPIILKDGDGNLWCFFNHHWTSNDYRHYIRVKSSTDDGQTWGSGPSDLGTALSAAWLEEGYVCACRHLSKLYAVYSVERSNLIMRANDLSNPGWSAESAIATSDYIDDQFQAAPSGDGKLGVVFIPSSAGKVYLKEYDGLLWSGLIEIESADCRTPQITYKDDTPHILFAKHLGNGYYAPRYARKSGGSFSLENLSASLGIFEKVLLFRDGASQQYQDKTSAAANTASGDVFHSESQGLLDSIGDCLYLGKEVKFYCAAVILSAFGSGGAVVWEYFNGTDWVEFTPYSGGYDFDSTDVMIYLWQDASSVPSGWQIGAVNGINAFWVRARVTNGFSTNPVGTQILAATKIDDMSLAHEEAQ